MVVFELVTGPMRSGKTTYSRSKDDLEYICFDDIMTQANNDFLAGLEIIIGILNQNPDKNFIMDGWFSIYNQDPLTVLKLQNRISHKIKFTAFYAPMEGLLERKSMLCEESQKYQTVEEIGKVYYHLIKMYSDDLSIFDFSFRTIDNEITSFEFSRNVRIDTVKKTKEEITDFKNRLKKRGYDIGYQNIFLPFGESIDSRGENTALAMWQSSNYVNFRGKTVLDIGCYHCDCTFKVEDLGAKSVTGIDYTAGAIQTSEELKEIWNYKTKLVHANIDYYEIQDRFDIVMCFNTIQYTNNINLCVSKIFSAGDIVIFESYEKFKEIYDSQTTHKLIHEEESKRWCPPSILRKLYIYERIK